MRAGHPLAEKRVLAQLAQDQAAGTSDGLELLVRTFSGPVTRFIDKRTPAGTDAADIWHETVTRIWRRWPSFNPRKGKLRTWIFNQAKYAVVDALRKAAALQAKRDAGVPDIIGPFGDAGTPLSTDEAVALRRAMANMSDTQRLLLWARFVDECPTNEISKRYLDGAIPADQTKVYISRARARLQKLYDNELNSRKQEKV